MMTSIPIYERSNQQLQETLDVLTKSNILRYDKNKAYLIIEIIQEQVERKRLTKERLDGLTNFDQSNLHLSKSKLDSDVDGGFIMAICKKDGIDILINNWINHFKYLENIIFVVNHESIHAVIDRILLEDGFDWFDNNCDGEYPMYAGGMDSLLGQTSSKNGLKWFLDDDAAKNTVQMFPEEYKNESGDYDL